MENATRVPEGDPRPAAPDAANVSAFHDRVSDIRTGREWRPHGGEDARAPGTCCCRLSQSGYGVVKIDTGAQKGRGPRPATPIGRPGVGASRSAARDVGP